MTCDCSGGGEDDDDDEDDEDEDGANENGGQGANAKGGELAVTTGAGAGQVQGMPTMDYWQMMSTQGTAGQGTPGASGQPGQAVTGSQFGTPGAAGAILPSSGRLSSKKRGASASGGDALTSPEMWMHQVRAMYWSLFSRFRFLWVVVVACVHVRACTFNLLRLDVTPAAWVMGYRVLRV